MLLPVGSRKIKNNLNTFLFQNGRSRALKEQNSIKTKYPQSKYMNFQCLKLVHDFLVSRELGQGHFSSSVIHSTHRACLTCLYQLYFKPAAILAGHAMVLASLYVVVFTATEVRPSSRASPGLFGNSDHVHGAMPHLLSMAPLILESLHLQLRLQIHQQLLLVSDNAKPPLLSMTPSVLQRPTKVASHRRFKDLCLAASLKYRLGFL